MFIVRCWFKLTSPVWLSSMVSKNITNIQMYLQKWCQNNDKTPEHTKDSRVSHLVLAHASSSRLGSEHAHVSGQKKRPFKVITWANTANTASSVCPLSMLICFQSHRASEYWSRHPCSLHVWLEGQVALSHLRSSHWVLRRKIIQPCLLLLGVLSVYSSLVGRNKTWSTSENAHASRTEATIPLCVSCLCSRLTVLYALYKCGNPFFPCWWGCHCAHHVSKHRVFYVGFSCWKSASRPFSTPRPPSPPL